MVKKIKENLLWVGLGATVGVAGLFFAIQVILSALPAFIIGATLGGYIVHKFREEKKDD